MRFVTIWGLGAAVAGIFSWVSYHSLLMLLFHIMLGWFYVIYRFMLCMPALF